MLRVAERVEHDADGHRATDEPDNVRRMPNRRLRSAPKPGEIPDDEPPLGPPRTTTKSGRPLPPYLRVVK